MLCKKCQVLNINGVPTHESGCPDSNINPYTKKPWITECMWCGSEFQPEDNENFCSNSCFLAFNGLDDE